MAKSGRTARIFGACGTFLLKKVWVPLLLLLVVQLGLLYVAVSEIEIPVNRLSPVFEFLRKEGLDCSIKELKLHNLTVLKAKDVRIETAGRREPLLVLRHCSLKLAPEAFIAQKFIPQTVYASGVEVFCPATNSASGGSERIVFDGVLRASRSRGEIRIETAGFRTTLFDFVAFGSIPGTRDFFLAADAPSRAGEKISAQVAQAAGTLSALLRRKSPGEIFVVARLENGGDRAEIDLTAMGEYLDFFGTTQVSEIVAHQNFSVSSARTVSPRGDFSVEAKKISAVFGDEFSKKIRVEAKDVFGATRIPDDVFSGVLTLPQTVSARVGSLRAVDFLRGEIDLQSALVEIAPKKADGNAFLPDVFFARGNVFCGESSVACAGTIDVSDVSDVSANLDYTVRADKSAVSAFPQLRGVSMQKDFRALTFSEFPEIRGNVDFSAGMNFERARFELFSGAMRCDEIRLNSLRVAGEISPKELRLSRIRARGADFVANADVFTQLSDAGDFRVRAWGTIDPSYLDGRLGWFWERIWRDLRPAPSETRPRADIDVYGNWSDRWEYVFGAIAGENCYGNGVLVDKICLRVYEDPLKIAAFDMRFLRGDDRVFGTLQWNYAMEPVYHYRDFRFLFNGSIPPKDVLQIVGEGLPEALSELETAGAGMAVVSGMFSGDPDFYPDKMLVNIEGEVPGAFSFFGIEGEDFAGEIRYDTGVVLVGMPFSAKSDSGTVRGTVRVALPETGHSALGSKVEIALDLKNIRRSRLMKIFSELGARVVTDDSEQAEDGGADVPAANGASENAVAQSDSADAGESVPAAAEDTSSIDATFAGTLVIPELKTLDATGKFTLDEEDLFELQIFGGFSRLLSMLKFDLTTFNLNRAEGSFTVRDGVVFLPDLRVFGDSGEIKIQADVDLADLGIEGEAVFRNLRGTRIPLLGTLVKWGSASTELLPVEIGGNIEKPEWSISPSISRLWSSDTAKFGVAPEKKSEKSVPAASEE